MDAESKHNLELMFQGICSEQAPPATMQQLMTFPDRKGLVEFLIVKLNLLTKRFRRGQPDSKLEWGVTHLLRHLKDVPADEAIGPMIEILDILKDASDSVLQDTILVALESAGVPALEPAYTKYRRDRDHPERASTWLWVLANLGVQDKRVYNALLDHLKTDPEEAILLMGEYGDKDALPLVEAFVTGAAHYLNDHQIDPFATGARFNDPIVSTYINTREALVIPKKGFLPDHPKFDQSVEALDKRLLKFASFAK